MSTIAQAGGVPIVGDWYNAAFYNWCNSQLGMTNIKFRVQSITGGGTSPTLGDIAKVLQDSWETNYPPMTGAETVLLGTKVNSLKPAIAQLPGVAASAVGIGLGAGNLPLQISGIVSLQTALAGRAYRGRMYIPFPDAVYDTPLLHFPTPAYTAFCATLVNDILALTTAVAAGGGQTVSWLYGIYHRAVIGPPPVPASFTPLAGFARPRAAWAGQHRRGDYGKLNPQLIPL